MSTKSRAHYVDCVRWARPRNFTSSEVCSGAPFRNSYSACIPASSHLCSSASMYAGP